MKKKPPLGGFSISTDFDLSWKPKPEKEFFWH